MKNFFLKRIVAVAECVGTKNHSEQPERILIVSTTGLGDTLWATPSIRALRTRYPNSYIAILTSRMGASLLAGNPNIDETFILNDPALPSLFSLYRPIKSRVIDTALIFHTSQRSVIPFCHLVGATRIIGTRGLCKGLDDLLTKSLPLRHEHEIFRRFAIVREIEAIPYDPTMEIHVKNEDHEFVNQFLKRHDVPDDALIVGLHPGAKDLFKQWHPERFMTLGKRLAEEMGCQMIVTGNDMEKKLVCSIAHSIPRAIPVHGQLSLHQLASLQKKMSLFITNDTGPMHLAAAMNTPILAIFGPTDPRLCGPIFATSYDIISTTPTCTPCLKKQCRQPLCLLQITPDQVFQKTLSFLEKPLEAIKEKNYPELNRLITSYD